MTKREDGGYTFTATPEDFPKKHKAAIVNIGIADTGEALRGWSLPKARGNGPSFTY